MKFDELIDNAKTKAPSAAVFDLIKEFEGFAANIVELAGKTGDEAEFQAFMQELSQSHERLKAQFTRTAASYGMTFEQFCEYIENSANFAPVDWKEIQGVKEQITKTLNIPEVAHKNNKMNQNIKI
jgi:hypothetical protein